MNQCIFVGRITKDLSLEKVGAKETATCKFTVATQRNFKNKEGKYDADFHFCTAWGPTAEYLVKYAGKGSLVSIVCEHRTETYEKDGKKLTASNFNVTQASILQGKGNAAEATEDVPDVSEVTDDVVEDVATADIDAEDLPF